jgi:hypothetical protein
MRVAEFNSPSRWRRRWRALLFKRHDCKVVLLRVVSRELSQDFVEEVVEMGKCS